MPPSFPQTVLAGLAALSLAGCGSQTAPGASPQAANAAAPVTGEITVLAAASLTESFTQLGKEFEAAHPGVKVRFNFGGSSTLAQQIDQGAPADVFASASPTNMKQASDTGSVEGESVTFARNRLQIAVPKDNPARISGLADFGKAERKIALCSGQVPCGAAATKVFRAAGITPQPDTLEQDVKAALTKVRLGEVDAALVYRTDVQSAANDVEDIEFPEADKAINDYPVAVLAKAPNPAGAKAFVDYVRSEKGRAALTSVGFDAP